MVVVLQKQPWKVLHKAFSNPGLVWAVCASLYWIALYPARFGIDINHLIEAYQKDYSVAQWTATWYRFLQLISINGNLMGLASLVGMFFYAISIEFYLRAFSRSRRNLDLCRALFAFSPFYGVFGMTLDHNLYTVIGAINFATLLKLKRGQLECLRLFESVLFRVFWLTLSFLFIQMTHQGALLAIVFSILYFRFRSIIVILLIVLFTLMSPKLLDVSDRWQNMKLFPFVADLKCVVQHPRVEITPNQLDVLEKMGKIDEWKKPQTCAVADHAFFALKNSQLSAREVIQLWAELTIKYPQLVITAHIQRSAMALPPPFFRGQPNMMPTDSRIPVGEGTSVELQQWSELFKSSIDNEILKNNRPNITLLLEPLPLLVAFIFNQNSAFWGWGGMWMMFYFLLIFTHDKKARNVLFQIFLLLFTLSMILFFVSPISSPRYAYLQIIVGILSLLDYIFTKTEWKKTSKSLEIPDNLKI